MDKEDEQGGFGKKLKLVKPSEIKEAGLPGGVMVEKPELPHEIILPKDYTLSIVPDELDADIREKLKHLAGKGCLLYGFPGVGKTVLIKKIALDYGARIVRVEKDMSVMQIKESFSLAKKIAKKGERIFVAIDEVDDFGKKEYARFGGISKIIALMTEFEGLKNEENSNWYVFATTNYLENVDQRLLRPGRLEEIIEVPFPDKETRRKILEVQMNGLESEDNVKQYLDLMSKKTNGFTPADLRSLLKRAFIHTIKNEGQLEKEALLELIAGFEPSVKRTFQYFQEPTVTVDDVVGRELYIQFFKKVFDNDDGYVNILLYGPRGTGKTFIPEVLASITEFNYIRVKGSEMQEGIVGEGTKNIKRLFNLARLSAPCILHIDEIEGMVTSRGIISHRDDETAYLNSELSMPHRGVYVIATINDPLRLNDTTLSRCEKVFFELPSQEERKEYLIKHLNGNANRYSDDIAEKTKGYSFRDLRFFKEVVNRYDGEVESGKLLSYVLKKYVPKLGTESWGEIKEELGDALDVPRFVAKVKTELK